MGGKTLHLRREESTTLAVPEQFVHLRSYHSGWKITARDLTGNEYTSHNPGTFGTRKTVFHDCFSAVRLRHSRTESRHNENEASDKTERIRRRNCLVRMAKLYFSLCGQITIRHSPGDDRKKLTSETCISFEIIPLAI